MDTMRYFDIHDIRKVLQQTFLIDRRQRELDFKRKAETMKIDYTNLETRYADLEAKCSNLETKNWNLVTASIELKTNYSSALEKLKVERALSKEQAQIFNEKYELLSQQSTMLIAKIEELKVTRKWDFFHMK